MKHSLADPMIQRQIIMEHYETPLNKGLVDDDSYQKVHITSESCIDDINLQLKVEDEIITDIRFDGIACAISTSTTSIMSQLLKGKNVNEAKNIIENYLNMIDGNDYDESVLKEAVVYKNVKKQPNRIKCATMPWQGLKDLLK